MALPDSKAHTTNGGGQSGAGSMLGATMGAGRLMVSEAPLEALAMQKRARARVDRETMFFFTANLLVCGLHRGIIGSNWAREEK